MALGKMMGLGGNPAYDAFDSRRNALMGFGAGLMSGNLGNAGLYAMQGRQQDDAYATQQKAEQERQEQLNQTVEWARTNFPEQLSNVPDHLAGDLAVKLWTEQFTGGGQGPIEINGQLVDPTTGQVIGDYRDGPEPGFRVLTPEEATQLGLPADGSFQVGPDNKISQIGGGGVNIDFNANQGTAAAFADRMTAAHAVLDDPKLTAAQVDLAEQGKSGIPLIGNFLTSEDRKKAEQAQRDFVNAILRRESGAVISDAEFDNAAKQYFPQPGDTPAVIEQKRRNREMAIAGVARAAGPSYQPPTLTPPGVVPYTDFFK